MYTLLQSSRIRGTAGEPLPTVFESLEAKGTRFLRGQLALVAAGPGTGKSAFVLTLALKAKVPTLYFSADTDAFTQLTRSISILTGMSLSQASRAVLNDDLGEVAKAFKGIPIRFNYNASPSLDDLELSMMSYGEVYGDFPALVVVDNITNLRDGASGNDDDPFAGLEALLDYLHTVARATGACVIGLHHVTGPYNDSDEPIPLSGVKGQVGRVPELILTLRRQGSEFGPDTMFVSTVKQRGGKADPTGNEAVELEFLGDTMQIRDFSYATT